jgi:hypothetical protein
MAWTAEKWSDINGGSNKLPIKPDAIYGLPMRYNQLADPDGRVFIETILKNSPIVSILPGRPEFIAKQKMEGAGIDFKDEKLIEKLSGFDEDNDKETFGFVIKNAKREEDLRYYGFKADLGDYFSYVQLMLSTIHAKLGLGVAYRFRLEQLESGMFANKALAFYCNKETNASESGTNDFTDSMLSGFAKKASSISREIRFLLGKDLVLNEKQPQNEKEQNFFEKMNAGIKSSVESLLEGASTLITGTSLLGDGAVSAIFNSVQLMFPEVWQDSKWSKDYTLGFKFFSPYGDRESLFNNVYVPFILLLALSLPRQDSLLGYYAPFIVRFDAPGWFTCDLGVVTSFSFKKGGDDDLWTSDGLPSEITVTMNIKDLYPALAMTNKFSSLRLNTGLSGFLDNMAGLHSQEINVLNNLSAFLNSRVNAVTGFVDRPGAAGRDKLQSAIFSINKLWN